MAHFKRGNLQLKTNQQIQLGDSQESLILYDGTDLLLKPSSGALRLYNDGTAVVETISTGLQAGVAAFDIKTSGGEDAITINNDGAVELFHDNVKQFETIATGIQGGGSWFDIKTSGGNDAIRMYDGSNVNLYYNGNPIVSTSTTGLQAGVAAFDIKTINGDDGITINEGGSVELFYNDAKRIETITTGIQAGVAAFDIKTSGGGDGITINNNGAVELFHNNVKTFETISTGLRAGVAAFDIKSSAGEDAITININGAVELFYAGVKTFETTSDGIKLNLGAATINEFSTDGTLVDDSDTALPTEKAVKTAVDAVWQERPTHQPLQGQSTLETWKTYDDVIPTGGTSDQSVVTFNNRIWNINGHITNYGTTTHRILSSVDGINWVNEGNTPAGMPGIDKIVVYKNALYSLGGLEASVTVVSDVWRSEDGVNWTQIGDLPAARWWPGILVFDNKLWAIGGFDSGYSKTDDVYYTVDGINWTTVGSGAFPVNIGYPSMTSFNGKMWSVGGDGAFTNVYYSTDGLSWGTYAAVLPAGRRGGYLTEYNSKLYYMGGEDSGLVGKSDIYMSTDGQNWSKIGDLPLVDGGISKHVRGDIFQGRIWIVGGRKNGAPSRDVFRIRPAISDELEVVDSDSNSIFIATYDGVELYHEGTKVLETDTTSVVVTGDIHCDDLYTSGDTIHVGTGQIKSTAGNLEFYHNDVKRLETDSTGVTVIGNLTTNDLTVDGNSIILGSTSLTETAGGGLTVDGDVVCDSVTSSSDTLQLGAGEMSWNPVDYTMDIPTGLGPVLQVGQEDYIIVYNDTGEDIPNGTPVYPVGAIGTTPKVDLARSDTYTTFSGNILMTTMLIPNGQIGICSERGKVRDVDTSSFNVGDVLWISDTVAGELVNVEPDFPAYGIQIGGVLVSDNTGVIELAIRGEDSHSTIVNAWNGVFRETFDFRITESGGVVTGTLTPSNSNVDMTMMFSDGFSLLDTSSANIVLVSGTDTVPQTNYIYILKSTKVLTVSTSSWPVTEHIRVANVVLQSAATTGTQGALRNQNWNDHVAGTDFQGHLSHIGAAIREKIQATWRSGTAGASTIDTGPTPDDVWVTVTGGIVQQMHEQAFPSFDTETGDILHIVNHSTTPYVTTSNLNTQLLDSNGVSLNSTSFSFVLWGVANKTGEASQLMINLPTGSYAFNTPSNAVSDALNYSVYSIPAQFSGVGFLIARFTYTYKNDVWVLFDTEDLRGKIPNTTAGGGGGGSGVTDFLQLTDTPSAYTSQALKYLRVAAGETAIEFSDADLATTEYVDDVNIHKIDPPSVTQTYSGTIIENITIDSTSSAFGTLVYRTTSGIYTEAIGSSDDTISTAIVVGASTVLIEGFVRDDALYAFGGGNLGKKIYLSPTVPGETVVTIPSGSGDVVQIVGEVWDNTTILFRPNSISVEII